MSPERDLRQVFELPNEIVEAVTRLVVTEGLIGAGNASRVVELSVGPLVGIHVASRLSGSTPAPTRTSSQHAAESKAIGAAAKTFNHKFKLRFLLRSSKVHEFGREPLELILDPGERIDTEMGNVNGWTPVARACPILRSAVAASVSPKAMGDFAPAP
jgi:hypothetical protein